MPNGTTTNKLLELLGKKPPITPPRPEVPTPKEIPEPRIEAPPEPISEELPPVFRELHQLFTMGGAVVTTPFRYHKAPFMDTEEEPWTRFNKYLSIYPGGRGYEIYEQWKGSPKEPSLLVGIPSWKQWGTWLGPILRNDITLRSMGVEPSEWEKVEGYEVARLGMGELAEFVPFIFMGLLRSAKTVLEKASDIAFKQIRKGKPAEEAINIAFKQLGERGKLPKFPILKEAEGVSVQLSPMPTIEELIAANYSSNAASRIGQRLTQAPGVTGQLSRNLLPMSAAKTDTERAVIAWMGQRDIAPSLARIGMDEVYAKDIPFKFAPSLYPKGKVPFKPIQEGIVKNVTPKDPAHKPYIQAIAEFPDRYILTADQKVEFNLLDRILQAQLARELAAGVDVHIVPLKVGQRYFPRFVREIIDLETKAIAEVRRGVSTRPGIRPGPFRERYYEEVLDGIVKGKKYSLDYRAAVEVRLTAGNKAISDKMLADFLEPLGQLPKERITLELRLGMEEITQRRVALKQISELIEHINAKEPVAWYRWLGVKKWYPEQYKELYNVSKAKKAVPQALKKFIVSAKKTLTETSKGITAKYRTEMKRAKKPILGKEGSINHAGLQGRLFPVEIADSANALIRGEITTHQVLNQLAKLNAVARMGQTAIDTGFALIQGLLTLVNHPQAWGRALGMTFQTLKNPKHWARFSITHAETKGLIATHGGAPFGGTEFTEAARAGGWLEKIPAVGKLFQRFGLAFESYIDTCRILITEAELPHYVRKLGRNLTGTELTDLTVAIDHMVGIGSMRRLGMSSFIRNLATNALYAPRYYLAFVSFLGRAFQGGVGGDLARKSLTKFSVAIPTFMTALAYALGQEDRVIPTKDKPIPAMFDPRTGELMTVEIAGTHMGLGGVWIAGMRLLGSLTRSALEDPSDFLSIDPHENPLLRYAYGRASPLASGAIDVITGHNFLGERLDTPDDYLKEIVDKTFPFWMAGQITDVPKAGWGKGMAEWWGLRAWMVQYREQAKRYAEDHIKDIPNEMVMPWQTDKIAEGRPLRYEDLNNEQRAWLLLTFEDYREAEEKRRGQKLEKGTDFEVADIRTREILDTAYQVDLEEVASGVVGGVATIADYQNQSEYLRRIRSGEYQYRETIRMFLDEERWEDVEKWIEENAKPEDKAYDKYMELRGNPPKVAGVPDWEAWEKTVDDYLTGLDTETREYVERRKDNWINNLPKNAQSVERLIWECETILDAYYEIPEGKPRLDYRDANPEVDARLIILRGLKPRTGLNLAIGLLDKYSVSRAMLGGEPTGEEVKPSGLTSEKLLELLGRK